MGEVMCEPVPLSIILSCCYSLPSIFCLTKLGSKLFDYPSENERLIPTTTTTILSNGPIPGHPGHPVCRVTRVHWQSVLYSSSCRRR